jgi:anti-anti-sigma factor
MSDVSATDTASMSRVCGARRTLRGDRERDTVRRRPQTPAVRRCATSGSVRQSRPQQAAGANAHQRCSRGRIRDRNPRRQRGLRRPATRARAGARAGGTVSTEPLSGDLAAISVDGEFDIGNAHLIAAAVGTVFDRGHRQAIIDLGGTTFLDCASLGVLMQAAAPLREDPEATVVLAGAVGAVKRFLGLVAVQRILPVADTRRAAIESLRPTLPADG